MRQVPSDQAVVAQLGEVAPGSGVGNLKGLCRLRVGDARVAGDEREQRIKPRIYLLIVEHLLKHLLDHLEHEFDERRAFALGICLRQRVIIRLLDVGAGVGAWLGAMSE